MTATMRRKSMTGLEFKAGPAGSFRATLATFNVVDKDGDVTMPGAFPIGKEVLVSAYQHTSWQGALPVGKGVVGADDHTAWIDGKFFLNTTPGKDTYLTVKELAASGLGEWSYGYDIKESSTDDSELQPYPGGVQILKNLDVFEASPVLIGAGVNTGTEYVKSIGRGTRKARSVAEKLKGMSPDPATLAAIAQIDLLTDQLDELVDTLMDDFGLVDPDESGELDEGQTDPAFNPKTLTLAGHSDYSLAAVQGFLQRVKARNAMRAKEGRALSATNRERLAALAEGLNGALADISDLLATAEPTPGKSATDDPELAALWLASIQQENQQRGAELGLN